MSGPDSGPDSDACQRAIKALAMLAWKSPPKHRAGFELGCPFARGYHWHPPEDCRCPRLVL